ncbi:thioredoxin-disulfide reductase [Desulfovibrio aminophilus]|uniref:thioredoxin-disulfide reductase n=1 Tax=Desulfovibrio aminophilus TaxID=81425 RepID=UPI0004856E79|nr:thioredoxin-disulfide reductase [Desulfovibrio aminophilus]
MKSYDAVVIGGGPAGMTAALYLLRAGASVALVEKLSPGGQVLMTSEIENYPGFPKGIKGYELADLMTAHVGVYPHDTLNDEVREIRTVGKRHQILVGSDWIEAKAVILCSGARYRKLGVPGEEAFIGRGVSYCALCDGNFFRDREVAVVGGGNSALEEALYLSRLVKKLHLIHRRDEFRGCKCYQDKCLAHPKMAVRTSSVVQEIAGDTEVRAVLVKNLKSGEVSEIPVDGVFIFVGFEPVIEFVPETVARDKGGLITDCEMRTNVPGIFAAGDIRSKNCRQVATAVGDGATAATAAFAYLEQLDA